MPPVVANAVRAIPYWFVIGGHAVRCLVPYRPSRHVDFGVLDAKTLEELVHVLRRRGKFEVLERDIDTIHGRFEGGPGTRAPRAKSASRTRRGTATGDRKRRRS